MRQGTSRVITAALTINTAAAAAAAAAAAPLLLLLTADAPVGTVP